ncbi:MAG: hypothetical protein ACYDBH_25475 [Acidobacteriaceae bacterium]
MQGLYRAAVRVQELARGDGGMWCGGGGEEMSAEHAWSAISAIDPFELSLILPGVAAIVAIAWVLWYYR